MVPQIPNNAANYWDSWENEESAGFRKDEYGDSTFPEDCEKEGETSE